MAVCAEIPGHGMLEPAHQNPLLEFWQVVWTWVNKWISLLLGFPICKVEEEHWSEDQRPSQDGVIRTHLMRRDCLRPLLYLCVLIPHCSGWQYRKNAFWPCFLFIWGTLPDLDIKTSWQFNPDIYDWAQPIKYDQKCRDAYRSRLVTGAICPCLLQYPEP